MMLADVPWINPAYDNLVKTYQPSAQALNRQKAVY